MTTCGVENDSSDGISTDLATTGSLVGGGVGGGGLAAADPAAACRMMLLHPNRMAAKEHGDEGSSSQVGTSPETLVIPFYRRNWLQVSRGCREAKKVKLKS